MRRSLFILVILILTLSIYGCYVHTPVKTEGARYLPKKEYKKIGVVLKDDSKKAGKYLEQLKVAAYKNLENKGFQVKFFDTLGEIEKGEKVSQPAFSKIPDLILVIRILRFGSEDQLVQTPATSNVLSANPSQSEDHVVLQPWDKDSSVYCESQYKRVVMAANLTDIRLRNRIWSAQAEAKPRVVGCSFLYKSYNQSLKLKEMAMKALERLLSQFPRR